MSNTTSTSSSSSSTNSNNIERCKKLPNSYSDIISILSPSLSSPVNDYLDEVILEPLSIINDTTLQQPVQQQTSKRIQSPIKSNTANNAKVKSNSKSTSSPAKESTNANTTGSLIGNTDKLFAQKQLELMTVIPSKPLLTCKNLFQAAKNYSNQSMVRDSSICLNKILSILSSDKVKLSSSSSQSTPLLESLMNDNQLLLQQQQQTAITVNIFSKIGLESKTLLYHARLTRLFDRELTESYIFNCLTSLNWIQNIHSLIKNQYFLRICLSDPLKLLNNLQQLVNTSINNNNNMESTQINTKETNSTTEEMNKSNQQHQLIIEHVKIMEEIAGILSFDRSNIVSIFIYILSISISTQIKLYQYSLKSIERVIRLFVGMGYDHLAIDFFFLQLSILNDNTMSIEGKENNSIESKIEGNINVEDIIIKCIRYSIDLNDYQRIRKCLEMIKQLQEQQQLTQNNDKLKSQTLLCTAILNNDSQLINDIRDRYEYLLSNDIELLQLINKSYNKLL